MPRSITLKPGVSPSNVQDGDRYLFPAGEFPPFRFAAQGVILQAVTPGTAWVVGGTAWGGEVPCAMRAGDGSDDLQILGLGFRGSPGRGPRVTASRNVILRNVTSLGHCLEAGTFGACPNLLIEASEFGQGNPHADSEEYPEDRRHALYVSLASHGAVLRDLYLHGVTGSALQLNGHDGPLLNVTVQRVRLEGAGSEGTLALSLMGLNDSILSELAFRGNNRQDEWLGVLTTDGNSGPCRRVTLKNFSPTSGEFRLEDRSTAVVEPGAGWQPGPPPAPPPAPRDPVGDILAKWAAAKSDGELLNACRASDLRLVIAEVRRLRGAA